MTNRKSSVFGREYKGWEESLLPSFVFSTLLRRVCLSTEWIKGVGWDKFMEVCTITHGIEL